MYYYLLSILTFVIYYFTRHLKTTLSGRTHLLCLLHNRSSGEIEVVLDGEVICGRGKAIFSKRNDSFNVDLPGAHEGVVRIMGGINRKTSYEFTLDGAVVPPMPYSGPATPRTVAASRIHNRGASPKGGGEGESGSSTDNMFKAGTANTRGAGGAGSSSSSSSGKEIFSPSSRRNKRKGIMAARKWHCQCRCQESDTKQFAEHTIMLLNSENPLKDPRIKMDGQQVVFSGGGGGGGEGKTATDSGISGFSDTDGSFSWRDPTGRHLFTMYLTEQPDTFDDGKKNLMSILELNGSLVRRAGK